MTVQAPHFWGAFSSFLDFKRKGVYIWQITNEILMREIGIIQ